jgi:hypothetical protein
MVSQPFLYICVGQYTIAMVEVTTQEYVYNISYIQYSYLSTFNNMSPQAEDGGSTRSLKRKAVNEEVGSDLVKTSAS